MTSPAENPVMEEGLSVSQGHAPSITAVTSGQSHTPGPWFAKPSLVSMNVCIYSSAVADEVGGYGIGEAWNINGEPENAANARLIAAAPELLEALQYLMTAHGEQLHDAYAAAHAAIMKATGQPLSSGAPPIGAAGEAEVANPARDEPSSLPAPDAQQGERREAIAKTLFQGFKRRAARNAAAFGGAPGSYASDEWENLPPSFKKDFYDDAEAILASAPPQQGEA